MKNGLVLEGGAMRGMFTAGVLDVLMEHNVEFDGAVGVSAGACMGCNYKSRQIRRSIRYNQRFSRNWRYCSVRSLLLTGDMFGAQFCYHTIPDKLDVFDTKTFAENPMEFYAVCTDIDTGKAVYHRCRTAGYDDLEWIRASSSMPLAARIVRIGEKKLLDGGVSDSIPLRFMEATGYDRNVVVLTQPRDYVKKPGKSAALVRRAYKNYPALVRAYEQRPAMYMSQLKHVRQSEKAGKAFVIAPAEKLPIGHIEHDPEKLVEVYRIGRLTALENMPKLLEFLGKDKA